jgi:hypothetical protein
MCDGKTGINDFSLFLSAFFKYIQMLRNISYGVTDGESPFQNVETRSELQNTEGIIQRKP